MKIRLDFVTNSSSSSFIICFARIADKEKAAFILKNHVMEREIYNASGIRWLMERNYGSLGAEWAGVEIYDADDIIRKYPDDMFVVIEDILDGEYSDEYQIEPQYSYDFERLPDINLITEENGFDNIYVQVGEGFNG